MNGYRRILVPVDGSPTGERGLRKAIRLAKKHGAKLVLLHVVDERPAFLEFDSRVDASEFVRALVREGRNVLKRARTLAGRSGLSPRALLRETFGEPAADEIVREAKRVRADLIVMGTHGRSRNARRVLRSAGVPVLVVRRHS